MRRLAAVLPEIEALGVRAVCVLPEDFEGEPAEFSPEYWDRELFLDKSLAFFAAAGGGRVRRGGLLEFLNPCGHFWRKAVPQAKRAAAELGIGGNLKGRMKGLKGGLLLVGPSGELVYRFAEEGFGDHADPKEVLSVCQRWAATMHGRT